MAGGKPGDRYKAAIDELRKWKLVPIEILPLPTTFDGPSSNIGITHTVKRCADALLAGDVATVHEILDMVADYLRTVPPFASEQFSWDVYGIFIAGDLAMFGVIATHATINRPEVVELIRTRFARPMLAGATLGSTRLGVRKMDPAQSTGALEPNRGLVTDGEYISGTKIHCVIPGNRCWVRGGDPDHFEFLDSTTWGWLVQWATGKLPAGSGWISDLLEILAAAQVVNGKTVRAFPGARLWGLTDEDFALVKAFRADPRNLANVEALLRWLEVNPMRRRTSARLYERGSAAILLAAADSSTGAQAFRCQCEEPFLFRGRLRPEGSMIVAAPLSGGRGGPDGAVEAHRSEWTGTYSVHMEQADGGMPTDIALPSELGALLLEVEFGGKDAATVNSKPLGATGEPPTEPSAPSPGGQQDRKGCALFGGFLA